MEREEESRESTVDIDRGAKEEKARVERTEGRRIMKENEELDKRAEAKNGIKGMKGGTLSPVSLSWYWFIGNIRRTESLVSSGSITTADPEDDMKPSCKR